MENVDINAEVEKVEQLIELDPYSVWYDEDQSLTNGAQAAGVDTSPVIVEKNK